MILRRWWLYLVLSLVVALLYGRLFAGGWRRPGKLSLELARGRADSSQRHAFEPDELKLKEILERSQQRPALAFGLGVFMLSGLGLVLGGLALSAKLVITGQAWRLFRYPSRLPFLWRLGDLGRLLLLLTLLVMLLPFAQLGLWLFLHSVPDQPHIWSLVTMFVVHGLLILLVLGFASTSGMRVSTIFGLVPERTGAAIRQSLLQYLAAFPWILGLLCAIAVIAQQLGIQPQVEAIQELIFTPGQPVLLVFTVLLACLVGPVAEEIFFRGILFTALRRHCARGLAMAISGALFAAVHTNLIGFVPIMLLGMLLADCYERTGSLSGPIAVHLVHNSMLMGLALTLKELRAVG